MKNKNLLLCLSLAVLAACNKNTPSAAPAATADTTPPVIALVGKTNDTLSLNSSYVDPGATAQDNVDGNITAQITSTSTINKDLVGSYQIYYNVKDNAGNVAAQMTRYVHVVNDADYLVGSYTVTSNCGATGTSNMTTTLSTSTTKNNQVSFGIINNVSYITPTVMVSGNAVNINQQTNGTASISGSGTIASNKKSFTLTYTAVSSNTTQGTYNCSATYVK